MFTFYCYSTLVQYSIIFLQKLVGYQMFFLLFTLHQTSLNFSNNSFFTSKDIYLFYLKLLTYPFIFGSFMHNGLFFIILVSAEKRINKNQLFNFCHMQTHQVLFYWSLHCLQLFEFCNTALLFGSIATNFQELLAISLISCSRKKYFFNRRGKWGFLFTNYYCLQIIFQIPKR